MMYWKPALLSMQRRQVHHVMARPSVPVNPGFIRNTYPAVLERRRCLAVLAALARVLVCFVASAAAPVAEVFLEVPIGRYHPKLAIDHRDIERHQFEQLPLQQLLQIALWRVPVILKSPAARSPVLALGLANSPLSVMLRRSLWHVAAAGEIRLAFSFANCVWQPMQRSCMACT